MFENGELESKSDRKDIESAPENMEIYDKSSPVNHEIITSEKNQEISGIQDKQKVCGTALKNTNGKNV